MPAWNRRTEVYARDEVRIIELTLTKVSFKPVGSFLVWLTNLHVTFDGKGTTFATSKEQVKRASCPSITVTSEGFPEMGDVNAKTTNT